MNSPPRLGLIAYEYPPLVGGMATYARAVAAYMRDQGWQVHVFANENSDNTDDGITVHPILTTDLARDLPRLARFDVDLWHSVNFGYAPLALLKRPFVLTVHGNDFLNPWVRFTMDRLPLLWRASGFMGRRSVRRAMYPFALRCVDHVLTCSRFSARRFRAEYPSTGPLTVVPNGVDPRFLFADHGAEPVSRHPGRLLTVCNLDTANQRKNVDGCLRAMAMLADRPNIEYWIVGDGPARPQLESLAAELGLADRVRFLGRVSDAELTQAYASSSLFVLVPRPSRADIEGFGIVYMEAAALGTPSLAGRYGGAPEAVADGVSGLFARDASPEAIAEALARFFSGELRFDPARVRQHAVNHTWPRVLARVERVYQQVLNRHISGDPSCREVGKRSHLDWSDPSVTELASLHSVTPRNAETAKRLAIPGVLRRAIRVNSHRTALIVGPYVGEIGWELMSWQGRVRWLFHRGRFDRLVVLGAEGKSGFYADMPLDYRTIDLSATPGSACEDRRLHRDTGEPVPPEAIRDLFEPAVTAVADEYKQAGWQARTAWPAYSCRFWPCDDDHQRFIRFHRPTAQQPTIPWVALVRRTRAVGSRNWTGDEWTEIADRLAAHGVRTSVFPCEAEAAIELLSHCDLAIGQSTGGLHLASLCGCPHVVWADEDDRLWTPLEMSNRQRYETVWNPLGTPVQYHGLSRLPTVEEVEGWALTGLKRIGRRTGTASARALFRQRWHLKDFLVRRVVHRPSFRRWPWPVQRRVRFQWV